MTKKINKLWLWFEKKGLSGEEIPLFINDAIRIIDKNGHGSLRSLNKELEDLGWGIQIMDETAYKQLRYFYRHNNYWV
jgi:hypothetical protein